MRLSISKTTLERLERIAKNIAARSVASGRIGFGIMGGSDLNFASAGKTLSVF
jgi:hypothetical protein